jgi:hypothetical protein
LVRAISQEGGAFMPVKPRARYLIFVLSWIAAFIVSLVVAQENGIRISREITLLVTLFLSLFPAAMSYLAISKIASIYDDWKYKSGHDIYREDQYEDDAGFIHLNQKSARVNKSETDLAEIFRDVRTLTVSAIRVDNPPDDQ